MAAKSGILAMAGLVEHPDFVACQQAGDQD